MKHLMEEEEHKLIEVLKLRFESNMYRHKTIVWNDVLTKLVNNHDKLWSLNQMEITGGEPDIVILNDSNKDYYFYDCAEETPIGRRNLCYDKAALDSRKQNKPLNNAIDTAFQMGIEILDEEEYLLLQTINSFDLKTSSWIKTPGSIRNLGGAIFGDCRYNRAFIYHNGADSYYRARGFRGKLKL